MNYHLESSQQNTHFDCGSTTNRVGTLKPKTGSTLQCEVNSKNDVAITKTQRNWVAYLFRQYDMPIPGWLRTRFVINQYRRKLLNDVFREAGVNDKYCKQCISQDDWSYHAHTVWHIVNEEQPCS